MTHPAIWGLNDRRSPRNQPVRYPGGSSLWISSGLSWQPALAYLAREVMALVDTGEYTLEEIQSQTLVPIELDLVRDDSGSGPGHVVRTVLDGLKRLSAQHRRNL